MTNSALSAALISKLDKHDMRSHIVNLYKQFETRFTIQHSTTAIRRKRVRNIVVTGLGGSAIGGDLLRALLSGKLDVPIIVNRNYTLPEFVSDSTLVIVSSNSGNTEETISAYKDAIRRKAQAICITSGGAIEKLAHAHKHYTVKIPSGYPPRAAIGFSVVPMLQTLAEFEFIKDPSKPIRETANYLREKSLHYANFNDGANLATELARKSVGKLTIVYTSDDLTSAVGTRWKGQICENAKVLAYSNVFPELNHNELVGWKLNDNLMKRTHVVMLHDDADHKRTTFRMKVTKDIVKKCSSFVSDVYSEGDSALTRMFSLILLGDWTSYYLAILNGIDPTPVDAIDHLKTALAKFEG